MDKKALSIFALKGFEHLSSWALLMAFLYAVGFDNIKAFASDQLNQDVNARIDTWELRQQQFQKDVESKIDKIRDRQRKDSDDIKLMLFNMSIGRPLTQPPESSSHD